MEAKISDIDFSILVFRKQPQAYDCPDPTSNYEDYMDPVYKESEIINVEVDVYSFGVVMFEILSGLMAYDRASYDDEDTDAADDDDYLKKHNLIKRVHHYYDDGLDNLIDPNIIDQIDSRSLHTYIETAYKCLSFNIKERPSINRIKRIDEALYIQVSISVIKLEFRHYQKLEDLLIPLTEISLATCDFSKDSQIGDGGFGMVYQGRRLSNRWQNHEAAIKRLDKTGLREDSRVIHKDVKSSNILLDENTEAKIYDFGLSNLDSAISQQHTKLFTNAAGTNYYMDHIYHESGILRTESDVYSFGLVMFEMLSGMLAWYRKSFGRDKRQPNLA
ncbi:protein kinase, ATP binding site-containing protein [Tanacetum coccineum]